MTHSQPHGLEIVLWVPLVEMHGFVSCHLKLWRKSSRDPLPRPQVAGNRSAKRAFRQATDPQCKQKCISIAKLKLQQAQLALGLACRNFFARSEMRHSRI